MKKILLLLFAISSAFLFSCHKNDFPDPKKVCQIKIIDREPGPTVGSVFEYQYNDKRLLTKLDPGFGHWFLTFEYNDQGRLLVVKYSNTDGSYSYYNLFYQNGLVTQIDFHYPEFNILEHGFFVYDNKGRLIEKRGLIISPVFPIIAMARYEYVGHSRNPSRQLFFRPTGESGQEVEVDPVIIREYKYDNKVNPQTTLINQPLSPFIHGDDFVVGPQYFEAIPDNNVVYTKVIRNIEGVYYNWVDNFITYEYNGHYPTFQTMRVVQHNPDGGPDLVRVAHTKMSYDCVNR